MSTPFRAFDEAGENDFIHTFPTGAKWLTVIGDKASKAQALVTPSKTEEQAKQTHADQLAAMQAGTLGEFQTKKIDVDDGA